jgi:hypothetical protein
MKLNNIQLSKVRSMYRALWAFRLDQAVSDDVAFSRMMYILSGPACSEK